MARRKQEIALQQEIETQEEWEDMLSKEGVFVIDVYQEWSGPTACLFANLRRLKNELGDDLLHFAAAKADTIDSLEKYRGRCEPCFLFYAGGVLVAVIRGANSPKILRTITEQLAQEHKVLDGQSERKEIKDTFIAQLESQEKLDEEDEKDEEEDKKRMKFKGEIINFDDSLEPAEGKKEVTVALIKPDAVKAGKVDEIIADIEAKGIEILKHEERSMTEDEVKQFYANLQEEEFFNDLVAFMTSGPSHILVLTKGKTGENIINEFRDLIGPTSVEEAKEKNPESLRAKHGEKDFMNALHGSSSDEMAMRELAFFFPEFVIPAAESKPKVQRTLALIRPDAFKNHKDEIIQSIQDSGFKVAMQKEMTLTKEMAEDFYKEHKDQDYFEELINRMTCGPVLALGLAREDAVSGWRQMLGPKEVDVAKEQEPDSLRAKFAVADVPINQLHGSDSEESAKKELEYFFPMEQTVAVIKPDAYGTKDEIIDRIHESGFRIAARKETTLTREIAEEFYSEHKDKEYYEELVEHMTSGPTYFMVLSREDAVEGWRSLIGPTDPEKAKEENPESLRAAYGKSLLQNAIHGSSTKEHAETTMTKIFGELKFNADGTVRDEQEMTEESQQQKPDEEGEQQSTEDAPKAEVPEQQQEEQATKVEGGVDAEETAPEEKHRDQEPQQEESKEQKTDSEEAPTQETTEQKSDSDQQQEQTEEAKPEEKTEEAKPQEEQAQEKSEEEAKPTEQAEEKKEEQQSEEAKPTEQKDETQEKSEEKAETPATEQKEDEGQKAEESEQKTEETEQKTEETEQKTEETEQKTEENKPAEGDKEEQKPKEDKPAEEG